MVRKALQVILLVAVAWVLVTHFAKTYGLTAPEHWGEHPVSAGY